MSNILVKDEKYEGNYVALASFGSDEVVSYGKDMETVVKDAKGLGVLEPVVVFIPNKNMTNLYTCL